MTTNALTREQVLQMARARKQVQQPTDASSNLWNDLKPRILAREVLPIISNSVLDSLVFPLNLTDEGGGMHNPDEILAEMLAEKIDYPFPDRTRLARVAQYASYSGFDAGTAKSKYLSFLKETLLLFAEMGDPSAVEELRPHIDEPGWTFTKLAAELDFPQAPEGKPNPLNLLARIPLPVYVTTSAYGFMERALEQEGRTPVTHVCFWDGQVPGEASHFYPDADFKPDPMTPVVYHLFGYEEAPSSLLISEDDHLDFLKGIARDRSNTVRPIIPSYLRGHLANSSLIMLGYRLPEWDFRVLFRGVIPLYIETQRYKSLAIQLEPQQQSGIADVGKAEKYLEAYFDKANFAVIWDDVFSFVGELWNKWNQWRQGQS
jgi:hypothetical protein